jgi:hypothetical protein
MHDWESLLRPPYISLIFGITLFSVGVVSTCTGKASGRFCWVYRAKEPVVFWWLVAFYYLSGVTFIGIFWLN